MTFAAAISGKPSFFGDDSEDSLEPAVFLMPARGDGCTAHPGPLPVRKIP
jgi:hypothetical protein